MEGRLDYLEGLLDAYDPMTQEYDVVLHQVERVHKMVAEDRRDEESRDKRISSDELERIRLTKETERLVLDERKLHFEEEKLAFEKECEQQRRELELQKLEFEREREERERESEKREMLVRAAKYGGEFMLVVLVTWRDYWVPPVSKTFSSIFQKMLRD